MYLFVCMCLFVCVRLLAVDKKAQSKEAQILTATSRRFIRLNTCICVCACGHVRVCARICTCVCVIEYTILCTVTHKYLYRRKPIFLSAFIDRLNCHRINDVR